MDLEKKNDTAGSAVDKEIEAIEKVIINHGELDQEMKSIFLEAMRRAPRTLNAELAKRNGTDTEIICNALRLISDERTDRVLMSRYRDALALTFPRVPGGVYEIH